MSLVTKVLLSWKILLLGFILLFSVSIINSQFPIVPVSSLTFIVSTILVWFTSVCITFICLHKLLQRNEPIEAVLCPKSIKKTKGQVKPDPDNIKALCEDIDKYFIEKWYQYITKDESFSNESKVLLLEVINRLLEVQLSVDNKALLHGILNIYLRHLKEFRRSLRRQQKYNGSIEELYRYSHVCSTNNRSKDYFLHQLANNVLHHFINSELWNSLPCQVLVSILARKLLAYILKVASNPEVLNYIILRSIASRDIKEKYDLDNYVRIQIINVDKGRNEPGEDTKGVDSNRETHDNVDGEVTVTSASGDEVLTEKGEKIESECIREHKGAVPKISLGIRRRRRMAIKKDIDVGEDPFEGSKAVSHPVKIHEPKNHKTTRTWSDSKDLALGVSLGQDPLDLLNRESTRTSAKPIFITTAKGDQDSSAHAANQFLNEVKHTTQATVEDFKKSIKPISDATVSTLHNIKDLQESTMNNALHKIGDFQDEAAGMVEGILDFGRAGLRKGLRLTGLQDSAAPAAGRQPTVGHGQPVPGQGCKRHPPVAAAVALTTRPESNEITTRTGSGDSVDNVWMNPLQMDSPNFDGQILLEKPAAKAEEAKEPEAMEFEGGRKEISRQIPSISTEEADCGLRSDQNSPEPEYEDTADLASSIAKLRSLLQQRSSESSLSTPALSPMPPDVADEQQVSAAAAGASFQQRPLPFEETDLIDEGGGETEAYGGAGGGVGGVGVMPTFYKFCAKTATGVLDKTLHTIKTALPAGHPHPFQQTGPDNAWIFILPDSDEADIFTRMKKLLTERKEFCTLDDEIDTAYEAIDSLDTFQLPYSPSVTFEDELEPFEVRVPVARALVEVACELLADTGCPFVQEPIVKTFLLTMGPTLEHLLVRQADALMETVCVRLMRVPDRTDRSTLRMEMSAYLDALVHSLPDCVKMTLGVSPVSQAMSVLMSSIQREAVNQDLALQLLELLALKLIEECGATQHSPPTSA